MATLYQSTQAAAIATVMTADGANDVVPIFGDFTITAANVINDIIEMVPLPANHVLVDLILDAPDMDTSTGITLDVGLMSGDWGSTAAGRTCGADYIAASTVAQAGGIVRASVTGFSQIAPTDADRSIGIKVHAAATGTAATSGTIRLTALVRAQRDSA